MSDLILMKINIKQQVDLQFNANTNVVNNIIRKRMISIKVKK